MELETLKPLVEWLQTNPGLAGLIVFGISLVECLAVIGMLVPGSLIMPAIGVLVGSGVLPGREILAWAISGALIGDIVSYWLGYHYHKQIRGMWPFRNYKPWVEKGERFFKRYGSKSVFFGRFLGPTRAFVPVVAGMLRLRPVKFLVPSVLASVVWAPLYILPGYLIGALSLQLAPRTATRFMVILAISALIVWIFLWLSRTLFKMLANKGYRAFKKLWLKLAPDPMTTPRYRLITDPLNPESPYQFMRVCLITLNIVLFSLLIISRHSSFVIGYLNLPVYHFFRGLHTEWSNIFFVNVTFLAEIPTMVALLVILGGWFAYLRRWHACIYWFANGIATMLVVAILKYFIYSPRPPGLAILQSPNSFPSGHTTLSVAIIGFLTVIVWEYLSKMRPYAIRAGTSFVIIIIISRLYMGAHWLSDILAGVFVGGTMLTFSTLLYHRKRRESIPALGVILVTVITLTLSWGWYYKHHYRQYLRDYTPHWVAKPIDAEKWWENIENGHVLMRKNFRGRPIQVLNVEWAGMLDDIENDMMDQSWKTVPKANIAELIGRIAAKDRSLQLPLLPKLYLDRTPVLVMTKIIDDPKRLVVLRLWDAYLTLEPINVPLWVGTVSIHKSNDVKLKEGERKILYLRSEMKALEILQTDLKGFRTKELINYDVVCPEDIKPEDCRERILMIRPNKN